MAELNLTNVSKAYGPVEVLRDINLHIETGELIVFVGPSGCGKSTLLRMIAGLERITGGVLTIDGEPMNDVPPAQRGIAMVFQSYALYPHMTVRDNMSFGMKIAKRPKAEIEKAVPEARSPAAFKAWVDAQFDPSVTWEDVAWVRDNWKGRLVVKGVLDPDDARRAADAGVDGIVVSNHGGRQLDSVPSTVRALPAVADAVGDRVEVLADGGVRNGLDAVKMVALGARAVLVGRPWAWAVAARGEVGVRHMLAVMRADIDTALGLTGSASIGAVDRSTLYRE